MNAVQQKVIAFSEKSKAQVSRKRIWHVCTCGQIPEGNAGRNEELGSEGTFPLIIMANTLVAKNVN